MKESTKALIELATAKELAEGKDGYHSFRGELYANDKHDVEWMRDVMNIYLGQYQVGLACLLFTQISQVKEVITKLNKKLETM